MEPTFTLADVTRLLAVAMDRPVTADNEQVFTLAEVADMTKMSLRQIENDCRKEHVEHVHQGHLRGMTRPQIAKLLARYTVQAKEKPKTEAEQRADAMAQAIEFNRNRTNRRAA